MPEIPPRPNRPVRGARMVAETCRLVSEIMDALEQSADFDEFKQRVSELEK